MGIQIGVIVGAIVLFAIFAYSMRKSIKKYEDEKKNKQKNRFRI